MPGVLEVLADEFAHMILQEDGSPQLWLAFILLPPAFGALFILSAPLPAAVKRMTIQLLDMFLFQKCRCCGIKFTLYKWCVILSAFFFITSWIDIEMNFSGRRHHRGGARASLEYRLEVAQDQKEWWVSLFCLSMYLVLDRFRKSVKHDLGMYKGTKKQ